eukprot:14523340-Alexandrium_andersonii.AAC.1
MQPTGRPFTLLGSRRPDGHAPPLFRVRATLSCAAPQSLGPPPAASCGSPTRAPSRVPGGPQSP